MKIQLKYAVIVAGAIALFNFILLEAIGLENPGIRALSTVMPLGFFAAGLFLGMKENRRLNYNGEINYGQSIFSGLTITFFIAVLLALNNMIYYGYINPKYSEVEINEYRKMATIMKLKTDAVEKQIQVIKFSYEPLSQLRGTFLFFSVLGIVLSAVFSMIVRTKDTFTHITKPRQ